MAAKDDNNPTEWDVTRVDAINRYCDSFHEVLQITGPDALPSIICLTSALDTNMARQPHPSAACCAECSVEIKIDFQIAISFLFGILWLVVCSPAVLDKSVRGVSDHGHCKNI